MNFERSSIPKKETEGRRKLKKLECSCYILLKDRAVEEDILRTFKETFQAPLI